MTDFVMETNQLPGLGSLEQLREVRLPLTRELDGRRFDLRLSSGGRFHLSLADGHAVFSASCGNWPAQGEGPAEVCRWRDNSYFIDINTVSPAVDGMSVVLLLDQGRAIVVYQHYTGDDTAQFDRGPHAAQEYRAASIDGAELSGAEPGITGELLGARLFMAFGTDDIREYILINKTRVVEHCVHTARLCGKVERHHATVYKLGEQLYLIGWREMDTGAGYVAVLDYANRRVTGKRFYMATPWEAASESTGAMLIPVNGRVDYVDGLEPTN